MGQFEDIERNLIDDIKNAVGNKKVLLGLSGGVDSSVLCCINS